MCECMRVYMHIVSLDKCLLRGNIISISIILSFDLLETVNTLLVSVAVRELVPQFDLKFKK